MKICGDLRKSVIARNAPANLRYPGYTGGVSETTSRQEAFRCLKETDTVAKVLTFKYE